MNAGARLALYGLGLVVAFGGAFGIAGAVVPSSVVANWMKGTNMNTHSGDHADSPTEHTDAVTEGPKGLSLGVAGYVLSPVDAPATIGAAGTLSFQVQDRTGAAVVDYETAHNKKLHLIVTRLDGSQFRHVHPELDSATGTWSIPWQWTAAGSYRVFADFTPAAADAPSLTLSRIVQVAGEFSPVEPEPSMISTVDGFEVTINGGLVAGSTSELTVSVSRDGEPVTTLEPYLGAFGHLVALRAGDLAYMHVHAAGGEPTAGATSGPGIVFAAEAPTAGRYLLYLDFQVDGRVHTAEFVLDAELGAHNGH